MKNICVFCGSGMGKKTIYRKHANNLGEALAEKSIGLVYGGASIGLMGTLANAVLEKGGRVTGVIPESLEKREVAHPHLSKLIVTKSMHERKATMATLSDAYITLPGGFGTLEELFETITWSQLHIHQKPIVILNTNGYYDDLFSFVKNAADQGYIDEKGLDLFSTADSIEECFTQLEKHDPKEPGSFDRTLI